MQLVQTKFFTYRQNNSGGWHDGPAITVIVEAIDADHANTRAQQLGLYFDGCYSGNDCSCCGDRWYAEDDSDAKDSPTIYSQSVEDYMEEGKYLWGGEELPEALISYLNGREVRYFKKDRRSDVVVVDTHDAEFQEVKKLT